MATRSNTNSTTKERYALSFAPDGTSVCVLCNEVCYREASATDPNAFQLGHIVSDANGGEFTFDNLAPMCRACNVWLGKTDTTTDKFHYKPHEVYTLVSEQAAKDSLSTRRIANGKAVARKAGNRL